jgi:chitinase
MTRKLERILVLCAAVTIGACSSSDEGDGGGADDGAGDDGADDSGSGDDGGDDPSGSGDDGGGDGASGDLPPDPLAAGPGIVVYWGQNGYGGAHPDDMASWEPTLGEVCAVPHYDVVVLAFMTSFISDRNGGLPETNFSFHCETPIHAEHPFLLRCPEIEADIASCHAAGKKVLLSMGGASGAYGFTGDAEAEAFAETVWDMFLGGEGEVRPFGDQSLDGVDLDIEGGGPAGYAAFARRLRAIMDEAGDGDRLITAAPQCPFPDAHLGPSPGSALGDAAEAFDYLFVQFYNNFCSGSSGAPFQETYAQWSALRAKGGPRIVVGLPATAEAAPAGGFVEPGALPALVDSVSGDPAFAGLMLWDVSFDRQSGDPTYGETADQSL